MSDIGGFTLSVAGLDEREELRVKSFTGSEGMGELFCFELDLVSRSSNIDFEKVLDQSATLTLIDKQGNERFINGVVASFEQGNTGFHFTQYRAVIMPMLHRLRYRSDNRIFQNKTVVEIMEAVLKEAGVMEIDFITKDPHEPREYCVQYRETDLEFIERLAAEEGFHYSFEHSEGSHKLVFADTILGNPTIDLGDIEFNANPGGRIEESYFKTFIWRKSIRTEHFSHRDYTFKFPDNQLEAMKGSGSYRKYDYPGRYKDFMVGQKFNEYQLDAERRDYAVGEITSDVVQLGEGCYFDFKGHENQNYDKRYLVTHMEHEGSQPQVLEEDAPESDNAGKSYYHNQLQVVEYGTNWRPYRRIRPVVDGPQIAKVVGPAGEEIYTDEFGRVKVQFPWDRYGESDEHSSCWIRVSQNWAGGTWGHMAIPRINQEVIVEFLEGDPDQPIIIGRTYHSSNRPPYMLPQNKTRMTIKSKTHKGEGYNELRFEDEDGKQELFMHGQKDITVIAKDNHSETVEKGSKSLEVQTGSSSISVKDSVSKQILDNNYTIINHGGSNAEIVAKGSKQTSIVVGSQVFTAKGSDIHILGGDKQYMIDGGKSEKILQGSRSEVHGRCVIIANQGISLVAGKSTINLDPEMGIVISGPEVQINPSKPEDGTLPKAGPFYSAEQMEDMPFNPFEYDPPQDFAQMSSNAPSPIAINPNFTPLSIPDIPSFVNPFMNDSIPFPLGDFISPFPLEAMEEASSLATFNGFNMGNMGMNIMPNDMPVFSSGDMMNMLPNISGYVPDPEESLGGWWDIAEQLLPDSIDLLCDELGIDKLGEEVTELLDVILHGPDLEDMKKHLPSSPTPKKAQTDMLMKSFGG